MGNHSTKIRIDGKWVDTLADILPATPGLMVLFVGKTPTLKSVEVGHYFQGRHGRMFWNLLVNNGLLCRKGPFEDDVLLEYGYGITDIVKVPRPYRSEPSVAEYRAGVPRVLDIISDHKPRVVVFIYKRVLDNVLRLGFRRNVKTRYGSNPDVDGLFGSCVFAFPMPGTPCRRSEAKAAMFELVTVLEAQFGGPTNDGSQ